VTWAAARAWLLPALRPEDGTEGELVAEIVAGRAQLWTGARSAMVTRLLAAPARRCIHAWLAGGDLDEILALVPGMEAWARTQGCTHATVNGRPGWRRALASQGYRQGGGELLKRL